MKQFIFFVVLLISTGCTQSPKQLKQAMIWHEVYIEAKSVVECVVMPDDVWLTYEEYALDNGVLRGDCSDIALWMKGRAKELGADMKYSWIALFKYEGEYKFHMAIMLDGIWNDPVIVPSSGIWTMNAFVPLSEYEEVTGMDLIESFKIEVIE